MAWKQQISFLASYTMNNSRPMRISFLFLSFHPTIFLIFFSIRAKVFIFIFEEGFSE